MEVLDQSLGIVEVVGLRGELLDGAAVGVVAENEAFYDKEGGEVVDTDEAGMLLAVDKWNDIIQVVKDSCCV